MKALLPIFLLLLTMTVSAQTGVTWNTETSISSNTFSNMNPRMTLDRAGNPLVIWGRMSDESVFFSRWNGTSFTAPVKLNAMMTIVTTSWMGPDIASYGDSVYVVMKQNPESDTTKHIFLAHSYNGGMTFSSPIRVDFIGDSASRFPTVTTDLVGNPIVAFMKFNSTFGPSSRWVVTKSADYGNTFSTDQKASGWGGSAEVCDCCPGAIVTNGNDCAMLYRNNNSNIRDTWVGLSNNGGTSFSNGCNVDNNNWMIMSCPSTGPDGFIIGDSLYSVFMNGASGDDRNYFSRTSISAASANSVSYLTGAIAGLSQQNYPRIANSGNAAAIAWEQVVGGNAQLPVLFTNDIRNGFPTNYDTLALTGVRNTDIAMNNDNIFVVWQDDNSGTVKYRRGTFTPNNTKINETNSENIFSISPNPSNNLVNIRLASDNCKLIVTDLLGSQIFSQQIPASQTNIQLSISDWNSGIYYITVQSGKSVSTQKLIKE